MSDSESFENNIISENTEYDPTEYKISSIKPEAIMNKFPVDMDNYSEDEKSDDENEVLDGLHKANALNHDIFGESDEEGDFEGFDENEVEKEMDKDVSEAPRDVSKSLPNKIPYSEVSSPFESDDHIEGRSTDIMRNFEGIIAKQKELNRLNRPRKKNYDDCNNAIDDKIFDVKAKMRLASLDDEEAYATGRPGLNKILLLPVVRNLLRQADIKEKLIENQFLVVIAQWLKPLPNHVLPPLDIRMLLLNALLEFPPLDNDALKESNIGKAVMYLCKHPKETAENKKIAAKLINSWSRKVFNLSDNYDNMTREDRLSRDRAICTKRKILDNDASANKDEESSGLASTKDYIIRPSWRVGNQNGTAEVRYESEDDGNEDSEGEEGNEHRANARLSAQVNSRKRPRVNDNVNRGVTAERVLRKVKDAAKRGRMVQRASNVSVQGRGLGV